MTGVGNTIQDMEVEAYHEGEIKRIRLSDFRGRCLVLIFYPANFTFVCPTELGEMSRLYDEFRKSGAEVVSVSTDTAYVHKAWSDASSTIKAMRFPMAADPSGRLCRAFGTYIEDEDVSYRATFIIDPDGVVKCAEMHDNSIGRSAMEIFRKLQASKHVCDHPGEVCPVGWERGRDTLKPSLELVGKI